MKIVKWLDENFEEVILMCLLVAITIVMTAQIFARYVLNNSMSWPEEFCRYCYVWTTFLSLSYSIRKGNMLRVGVVMDLFPTKVQNSVRILCNLVMLSLFGLFFRHSLIVINNIKNITREMSTAMRLPMWIVYMSTVIGFGLSFVRSLQMIVHNIRHFNDKAESTIEATRKEATAEAKLAVEGGAK